MRRSTAPQAPPAENGRFRRSQADGFRLIETRFARAATLVFALALIAVPLLGSPFYIDLATPLFLAAIGALALRLLTGTAGQIGLGHAELIAVGAFAAGILFKEDALPFWVTIPLAAVTGARLGLIFGLPSLRLCGLYPRFRPSRCISSWSISAANTRHGRVFDRCPRRSAIAFRVRSLRSRGVVFLDAARCP